MKTDDKPIINKEGHVISEYGPVVQNKVINRGIDIGIKQHV